MSALLETLRYDGAQSTTLAASQDTFDSEGKFGIPRFSGEPAQLPEYAFRVQMRMLREKGMEESELKKVGPLGIRLVEGLRGQALRLAQQLKPEDLAKQSGPETLLKLFNDTLKPRASQEARELYSAGSKEGGMLSRQSGESMSSYITRRRSWWIALKGLDSAVAIPDVILAEQLLTNAQISGDQRLMVRTMLQGTLTFDAVASELIAQHPRIHEFEKQRGGKGYGNHSRPWSRPQGHQHRHNKPFRSYLAEDADEWESQDLTGFDEVEEDQTAYLQDTETVVEEDAEVYLEEHMCFLIENGMDMDNEEACALAAETLQLEYEAYNVRQHASGKGHGGFHQARQFDVSGQLSFQERKARLMQLKSKTECRRCHQKGHWSGDPQCPKGSRKGSGKFSGRSPSTSSTSPPSTSKSGKGKSSGMCKPRVVYFSMKEHEDVPDPGTEKAWCGMAIKEDPRGRGVCIPPPSSLQSPSRSTAPPTTSPPTGLRAKAAPTQPAVVDAMALSLTRVPQLPFGVPRNDSAQVELQDAGTEALVERSLHLAPSELRGRPLTQDEMDEQALHAALHMVADMEAMEVESEGYEPSIYDPSLMSFELVPHAPGPSSGYGQSGIPPKAPSVPPLPQRHQGPECEHKKTTKKGTNKYYTMVSCVDCGAILEKTRKPETSTPAKSAPSPLPATVEQELCPHHRISWKGTNGCQTRQTCLDCGFVRIGRPKSAPAPSRYSSSAEGDLPLSFTPQMAQAVFRMSSMMALIKHNETGENLTSEDLSRLLRGAMLSIVNWPPEDSFTDSNAQATFSPGPRPSCTGTPPASTAASPVPTPDRGTVRDSRHVKILNFGRYKGQSYEKAYQDASYVNWVLGELNEDSNPIFMHLGRYFEDRRMAERSNTAFMATKTIEVSDTEEDFPTSETIASETDLIAILDSGCNKTCHGELWLQKYAAAVGHSIDEFPMNSETGSFRGIGGSVTVLGLRSLQVGFELADGGIAIGDIDSTELQGSSAPLLLSIGDQRKLGLCIELGNTESVFSRTLNCQLKIAEINGLLGLRLLPSHAHRHDVPDLR